jgi:phage terminase large subunit
MQAFCLSQNVIKFSMGDEGGGKSWAFAIALLSIGLNRPIRVLCARELQVSIQDSVHKLLSDIIGKYPGLSAFYEVQNKTIKGLNGTEFNFKGLKHNANEIKSYEGVDYVWVEEAQAVSSKSWEVLIPTVRKEGSEIWLSFNPKNATDPTWQRFVIGKDENTLVKKVNWDSNPFFPEVLNQERLRLLANDPEAYKHVYEGEFDTRYSG